MNSVDLINSKFGKLLVLSKSHSDKWGSMWWKCQCECGNVLSVRSCRLKSGITQSCGCISSGIPVEDLTGQTFNRLTVIKWIGTDTYYSSKWECICECGNITVVRRTALITGRIKSCGCYKHEKCLARVGSANPNYNPQLTDNDRISRRCVPGCKEWSKSIKEQYNFRCDNCGSHEPNQLVSHHLFDYKDYPDLRFDLQNGVCLCPNCHRKFHKQYGQRFNTKNQYLEFKENSNGNI